MRKTVLSAAFILALVSCSKEFSPAPAVFTMEAVMPSAQTKVTLGARNAGVYPLCWAEGDVITVNGVTSLPLTAARAGEKTALFAFDQSISAPYTVLYGATRPTLLSPPQVQEYSDGGIRGDYLRMDASTSDVTFTFSHRTAVVSLSLSGSETLVGAELCSLDGSLLADCGASSVQLLFPEGGLNLSGSKTLYFAVCPGVHAKGLDIRLIASDGRVMHTAALGGATLSAGVVYELGTYAFTANAETVELIASYADLKAFALRVADGELYLKARLVSDIQADGTWTPMEGFKGELDGGGHRIFALTKPLFNELVGSVRNLRVEADITVSSAADIVGDATVYWAGILANRLYTYATVTNCVTEGSICYTQWGKELRVGGIAGYAPRGTVSGCVNKASITAIGDGSASVEAGGLIGRNYASADELILRNCRNEGAILLKGSLKGVYAGGIIGMMDSRHTSVLSGDVNEASILIESTAVISGEVRLGGIAGYALADLADCCNYGLVHSAAPMTHPQSVGGIAGQVITASVSGCVNAGSIVLDAASGGVIRCGGILGFASSDESVGAITLDGCRYSGSILVDVASHSTLFAKPITGLYSDLTQTELSCTSTGTVTVK